MLLSASAVVLAGILAWYFYYKYCFTYWRRRGLPCKPPVFPAGNVTSSMLGLESIFVKFQNLHSEFKKKGYKHAGLYLFNGPVYFPIAPEMINNILTTDSDHFLDRGFYHNEQKFPLSAHLFALTGNKWRTMRSKLTPTFTSAKLKVMYKEAFMKNTEILVNVIEPTAGRNGTLNTKKVLQNFTFNIIGASAFGIEANALTEESEVAKVISTLLNPPLWAFIITVLGEGLKNPGNLIKVMYYNKMGTRFFIDMVKNLTKCYEENKMIRNNFVSYLMKVRDKVGLTPNEMVAGVFMFFIAAYESSASTISYCLHELAYNPQVQDKLRAEIYEKIGKDFKTYTYEDVLKLPYLDKVVKETLRMYPILGILNRICVKTYQVPGTNVVIEKGTPVLISTLGLHRDPEYFPNPLQFDPERFNDDASILPFTYLPFGEGPRNCIGMRYGQLQVKLGVAAVISKYTVWPSEKSLKYVEFDTFSTTLSMTKREGMFVKFSKV